MSKEKLIELLQINRQEELNKLFQKARKTREKVFGNKVFLYGFVYFSTWCRNDCNFCYYRKSNKIDRYRKGTAEVIKLAESLADSGVHLIDLTMGEDPQYHSEDFSSVLEIAKGIKESTGLPVMISPGVVDLHLIDRFAEIGTDWYALYQETHNRDLFRKLRIDQDYDERMTTKRYAAEKGMLIEEGLLSGIGESASDLADSIITMGEIGAGQVRVMSFVPQKGSPMEHIKTPDRNMELKIIAAMRLMYPEALIPASLDVDGIQGLRERIEAGANVVTSIIPPKTGLMGVAQGSMDVDEGGRTVEEVDSILKTMGMRAATADEYKEYIKTLKANQKKMKSAYRPVLKI